MQLAISGITRLDDWYVLLNLFEQSGWQLISKRTAAARRAYDRENSLVEGCSLIVTEAGTDSARSSISAGAEMISIPPSDFVRLAGPAECKFLRLKK
jgi:hypothetical protein